MPRPFQQIQGHFFRPQDRGQFFGEINGLQAGHRIVLGAVLEQEGRDTPNSGDFSP
jgi:hypothetical protein